jgi:L-ascorbate metabolism protein UlaG (beta-lactamase superfamily)
MIIVDLMSLRRRAALALLAVVLGGAGGGTSAVAQTPPRFETLEVRTNGTVSLRIAATVGRRYRLEMSEGLTQWVPRSTFAGGPAVSYVDSGHRSEGPRFYRVRDLDDPAAFTGDHLPTAAGDAVVRPVNHASLVVQWNGLVVYVDPVGGATPYASLPRADLLLVTHTHGDHFDNATLAAVGKAGAPIVAPAAVFASLTAALKTRATPLANGQVTNLLGVGIEAVPAYNANHPKGAGNGYVLGLGGKRIYLSGDTGDAPELRAMTGIDAAFVCMNTPFTMNVSQAAAMVRAFRPAAVYPYHFRNSDGTFSNLEEFRRQVGADEGVEVRVRSWY